MPETKDTNRLLLIAMVAVIGALVVAVLALVLVISGDSDDDSSEGRADEEGLPATLKVVDAERGDCVDVTTEDFDSVSLVLSSCEADHDAEISWVGRYADVEGSQFVPPGDPDDITDEEISLGVCTSLMDSADVEAIGDDVIYQLVNEDGSPSSDEASLCYASPGNGESFASKMLP